MAGMSVFDSSISTELEQVVLSVFDFVDPVNKVKNQATRIITQAMKSTPMVELKTFTGLQSLEDRKDYKLLTQAVKLKRLQDKPMRQRLS